MAHEWYHPPNPEPAPISVSGARGFISVDGWHQDVVFMRNLRAIDDHGNDKMKGANDGDVVAWRLTNQFVTDGARDMASWRRLGDFDRAESEVAAASVNNAPASAKLFRQDSAPGVYARPRFESSSDDDGEDEQKAGHAVPPRHAPMARAVSVPSATRQLTGGTTTTTRVPKQVRTLVIQEGLHRPELGVTQQRQLRELVVQPFVQELAALDILMARLVARAVPESVAGTAADVDPLSGIDALGAVRGFLSMLMDVFVPFPDRMSMLQALLYTYQQGHMSLKMFRRNTSLLADGRVDEYIARSLDRPDASTPPAWVSPPLIALHPATDDGLAFDETTRILIRAVYVGQMVPLIPPAHPNRQLRGAVVRVVERAAEPVVVVGVLDKYQSRPAVMRQGKYQRLYNQRWLLAPLHGGPRMAVRVPAELRHKYDNDPQTLFVADAQPDAYFPSGDIKTCPIQLGVLRTETFSSDLRGHADALLRQHGLEDRVTFPPSVAVNVQAAHEALAHEVAARQRAGLDLRGSHRVFTIDPPSSMDLDDALSVRVLPNGKLELGVHIADPTHFVGAGSRLDVEAQRRCETLYLKRGSHPMLPRPLSEGLCSLLPNKTRLAVSCFFEMSLTGEYNNKDLGTLKPRFQLSVVRSCARLTYAQAQRFLDMAPPTNVVLHQGVTMQQLSRDLRLAHHAAGIMSSKRRQMPSLDTNDTLVYEFDDDGNPVNAYAAEDGATGAHNLIEEFALIVNRMAATLLVNSGDPRLQRLAVLRTQPHPKPSALRKLEALCHARGIKFDASTTEKLTASLESVRAKYGEHQFATLLPFMRTQRARYDAYGHLLTAFMINERRHPLFHEDVDHDGDAAEYGAGNPQLVQDVAAAHYNLGFDLYSNFTSPIRRYPDILTHRLIKTMIAQSHVPRPPLDDVAKAALLQEQEQLQAYLRSVCQTMDRCRRGGGAVSSLYRTHLLNKYANSCNPHGLSSSACGSAPSSPRSPPVRRVLCTAMVTSFDTGAIETRVITPAYMPKMTLRKQGLEPGVKFEVFELSQGSDGVQLTVRWPHGGDDGGPVVTGPYRMFQYVQFYARVRAKRGVVVSLEPVWNATLAQREVDPPAGPTAVGLFGVVGHLPQPRVPRSTSYVDDVPVPVRRLPPPVREPRAGRQASYHNSLQAMFDTESSADYSLVWPVRLLSTATSHDPSGGSGVGGARAGALLADTDDENDDDVGAGAGSGAGAGATPAAPVAPGFKWSPDAARASSAVQRAVQAGLPPLVQPKPPAGGGSEEVPAAAALAPTTRPPVPAFTWSADAAVVSSAVQRAVQARLSVGKPQPAGASPSPVPGGGGAGAPAARAPAPAPPVPAFTWSPDAARASPSVGHAVQAALSRSGSRKPPAPAAHGPPGDAPAPPRRVVLGRQQPPPEVWDTLFDAESGYVYYQNVETLEINLTKPRGSGHIVNPGANPGAGRAHSGGSGRSTSGGSVAPVANGLSRMTSAELARRSGNIWM